MIHTHCVTQSVNEARNGRQTISVQPTQPPTEPLRSRSQFKHDIGTGESHLPHTFAHLDLIA